MFLILFLGSTRLNQGRLVLTKQRTIPSQPKMKFYQLLDLYALAHTISIVRTFVSVSFFKIFHFHGELTENDILSLPLRIAQTLLKQRPVLKPLFNFLFIILQGTDCDLQRPMVLPPRYN